MKQDNQNGNGGIAAIEPQALPWEPLAPRAWFKLLRSSQDGGWTSLVRLEAGGRVPLHRHEGRVQGYVLEGEGAYGVTPHRVSAGSFVVEGEGCVDELQNTGTGELVVLFVVEGPVRFLAQDGRPEVLSTAQDKVARWPHAYVADCRVATGGAA